MAEKKLNTGMRGCVEVSSGVKKKVKKTYPKAKQKPYIGLKFLEKPLVRYY